MTKLQLRPAHIPKGWVTKGKDIGKGLSILLRHHLDEAHIYEDMRAFGAPSECYPSERQRARKERRLRKKIKAATGLKMSEFEKEVQRRTSGKVAHQLLNGERYKLTSRLQDAYPLLFRWREP